MSVNLEYQIKAFLPFAHSYQITFKLTNLLTFRPAVKWDIGVLVKFIKTQNSLLFNFSSLAVVTSQYHSKLPPICASPKLMNFFRIKAIVELVIFVGLIFCGLGSPDNFVGLYFRGVSPRYIAKIQ